MHEKRTYETDFSVHAVRAQGFAFRAHWHREIEILYGISGEMTIGINAENYILRQGDLLIVESGDIHYHSNNYGQAAFIMIIFSPDLLYSDLQHGHFLSPYIPRAELERMGIADEISQITCRICGEMERHPAYFKSLVRADLCRLYAVALQNLPQADRLALRNSRHTELLEQLQQLLDYIDESYTSKITLEQAASRMHFSQWHFSKLFKNLTGTGFVSYVNAVRIQKARQMLASGSQTVMDIALGCGFESIRTFNRVFSQECGCTPAEYRRRNK